MMVKDNLLIDQYLSIFESMENLMEPQLRRILLQKGKAEIKAAFFDFDNNFDHKVSVLEDDCGESLNNYFVNMFHFFRKNNVISDKEKILYLESEDQDYKLTYRESEKGSPQNQKKYKERRTFDENNVLRLVEYLDESLSLIKFDELDDKGFLHRRVLLKSGIVSNETYYRADGSCYLSMINIRNSMELLYKPVYFLFNRSEQVVGKFSSSLELQQYFLEQLVNKVNTVIITNQIETYKIIEEFNNNYAYKIHFMNQYFKRDLCSGDLNPTSLDGIIFSTNLEKDEAVEEFGNRNNYFIIPPFLKNGASHYGKREQNNRMQVTIKVSKNEMFLLEQVIRAFRITIDKAPNTILNICGTDIIDYKNVDLIRTLDLVDNIEFKGVIPEMELAYQSSVFSVLLNSDENNGVDILQSLLAGCPVLSFDASYLANELITNNNNGFIVDNESISDLSDKMIKMLTEPSLLDDMSYNACITSEKYSEDNYLEKWSTAISSVLKNRNKRTLLKDMTGHILDCKWTSMHSFNIQCRLFLEGETSKESNPSIYLILQNKKYGTQVSIYGEINQVDHLVYELSFIMDFSDLDLSGGTWEMYITVEWGNSYLHRRLENTKLTDFSEDLKESIVNNRIITPFFTVKENALGFKIGRFIPEEEELIKLESKLR